VHDRNEILPECKVKFDNQVDDITGMRISLFGENGLGGVCGALKDKVSKKTLSLIAIIISGFIVAGLTAWGNSKENISKNKESISVIQSELTHIKETTDNIERNQIDPDEFLRAIEKMVKK